MKLDTSYINGEWKRMCQAFNRPVVRKRIDMEWGIYGDKNASRPVVGLDIDGEWSYKLTCALKILALTMLIMWVMCQVSRWMRRLF